MAQSFFRGQPHAEVYAKFRFGPPPELIKNILEYTQEKLTPPLLKALDVGCGAGQSTIDLAPHFQHVLGTDIESSQVEEARKFAEGQKNVEFSAAPAEQLPVEDNSIQLLTASESFHYFNAEKFYSEARRVLVPNGTLAVYMYKVPVLKTWDQVIDQQLVECQSQLLQGFRKTPSLVQEGYKSVELPFADTQRIDTYSMSKTINVAYYESYLCTNSSYQKYIKDHGQEAAQKVLSDHIKRTMQILKSTKSPEDTKVELYFDYILLLGRKEA